MIGPILVFLGVCGLVAAFMCIAHSFLRESEKGEQPMPEFEPANKDSSSTRSHTESLREPRWAH